MAIHITIQDEVNHPEPINLPVPITQSQLQSAAQELIRNRFDKRPVPKVGLSQALQRACPEERLVPGIFKGMSQEKAYPKHYQGPVSTEALAIPRFGRGDSKVEDGLRP